MFKITGGKGFHVTFENGWTVSVQFGPGNYADNRDLRIADDDILAGERGSATAEVACWAHHGDFQQFPDGDTVRGWATPAEVLALLNEVAAKPAEGR